MGKFVTRGHHAQRIEKVMLSRKAKAQRRGEKKSVPRSLGSPASPGKSGAPDKKGPDAPAP